ncbi:MAG: hypothetical protein JEZ11_05215 [Desulfobacterales bacterium]|nr:hypothetical protein [Desulfobacterales bacterium]
MREISIVKDYDVKDLGDDYEVDRIIEKLDIQNEETIELNLRHCFIDYPMASKIVDTILAQMKNVEGKKELIIKHDYYLPEPMLLNMLLFGSRFFNVTSETSLSLKEFKSLIVDKVSQIETKLKIVIVDRKGEIIESFEYGKR